MTHGRMLIFLTLLALTGSVACVSPPSYDYSRYVEADPHSILVVPVMNNSPEVGADAYFLATITVPLVERGYYVFPVNMSRNLLADAGLSDPGLIREADATKLASLFGADAILYVVITNWEAKYMLLTTTVTVGFEYLLKSGATGETLWETSQVLVYQPQATSTGNGIADLVVMAVQAAATKAAPNYMPLARQANLSVAMGANPQNPGFMVHNPLLPGPLNDAAYAEDRSARTAAAATGRGSSD
jgi:hypothetical protein